MPSRRLTVARPVRTDAISRRTRSIALVESAACEQRHTHRVEVIARHRVELHLRQAFAGLRQRPEDVLTTTFDLGHDELDSTHRVSALFRF